ncbi:MAG: hypothetical protein CL862_10180 [Cyanobium sp. NAT70]|nr:hypothetical protein [Cyanobium sp. NAT70]|tara:strand:- start:2251 stop:2865 length:615 start_codon:yes stop_codon:yes gene_type:complete
MKNNAYRYEQTAARLTVQGYPDLSDGQSDDAIGILSSWSLQLVASPELEGSRQHLEALMAVVMPYARHRLSGISRRFDSEQGFVSISHEDSLHTLRLRSSRENVEPLELKLDDAELSDLVRCLDRLRLDERVRLSWQLQPDRPLPRQDLAERIPLRRRFGPSVLGGAALAASAAVALLLPLPPLQEQAPESTATANPSATQTER